jgi:DNA sulfur modification protein DndB
MNTSQTETVEIITASSYEDARIQASDEGTSSGGSVYPVVIFAQGNRQSVCGAIAIKQIGRHIDFSNESKKGDSPDKVMQDKNRPLMPDHVENIADYLYDNAMGGGTYILPPVTLNVKEKVRVYTGPGSSPTKLGYLVLPDAATIEITDGQHRIHGSRKALWKMNAEDRDSFSQNALAFMLTAEKDTRQIHQDFADCSKTRPIPPSLLTVYDLRQPANGLVIDLIEACPLFRHKVDSTGKTVGKNSLALFVTNQVRQMVKTMLTGDMAMSEPQFVDHAKKLLPDDVECQKVLKRFVEFINLLTEHIEPWKEAATIFKGSDMSKVKSLRNKQSIALTVTGLNIIGAIGYELFAEVNDWKPFAERLGKLDYRKSNPLWKDVLTAKINKAGQEVFQVATQRGPVTRAVARVRQEIGLDPEPKRGTVEERSLTTW